VERREKRVEETGGEETGGEGDWMRGTRRE
jgi:hypothetical protein